MTYTYDWYFDQYLDTYGLVTPYEDIYTDQYTDTYGIIPGPPALVPSIGTAGGALQDTRPQTGFGSIAGIPGRGAVLEAPRGRGYVGLVQEREPGDGHDWSEAVPEPEPGPSVAEVAQQEAARAARALLAAGRILAPEPYVRRPQAAACGREKIVGGRMLRCGRAPHRDGMHYADGLYWR